MLTQTETVIDTFGVMHLRPKFLWVESRIPIGA
jgi:hypothetical protein